MQSQGLKGELKACHKQSHCSKHLIREAPFVSSITVVVARLLALFLFYFLRIFVAENSEDSANRRCFFCFCFCSIGLVFSTTCIKPQVLFCTFPVVQHSIYHTFWFVLFCTFAVVDHSINHTFWLVLYICSRKALDKPRILFWSVFFYCPFGYASMSINRVGFCALLRSKKMIFHWVFSLLELIPFS